MSTDPTESPNEVNEAIITPPAPVLETVASDAVNTVNVGPIVPPRLGSSFNPFVVPDNTPPRLGSLLNPHVVSDDSPPRRQARDVGSGGVAWAPGHEPASPVIRRTPASRTVEAVQARIRALEASVLNPIPEALRPPTAGPSVPRRRSGNGTRSRALAALDTLAESRRGRILAPEISSATNRGLRIPRLPSEPYQRSIASSLSITQTTRRLDLSRAGGREWRSQALTEKELYLTDARPPEQLAIPGKEYHECGICRLVKSHPVSYRCGHSHCYACIRMWLERKWTCPQCVRIMYEEPTRHYGEEGSIAAEYPDWANTSKVSYSFLGLTFPRKAVTCNLPSL
ncbi:hypothetical protein B0H15DRAFT_951688 [Mycena belliarum]|uniref:RING-type domain-containing protein n=1 Tax=Mycena belliarum TaxID=1033014 RepID=A0AAD6TYB0_9AGAR|nr:hypothetical protein B0H15DRAFT_951688 [Mycena belliae]